MSQRPNVAEYRALVDAKLTELMLYAKEVCPAAVVDAGTAVCEDEDGFVYVFPPPGLSEEEEERIELAVAHRAGAILQETGLFVACAVLDPTAR